MAANAAFNMPRLRHDRHFRGTVPLTMDYSDEQLRQRFRFGRETIDYLANELRGSLERPTAKRTALSVEQQIMIALRCYGSGAQLQVVGDTLGFDKSTVSRVVDSVTDALVARKDQHIKWPMEIQQLNTIKEGFYRKAHFPNVIGCVDGTHVRIQAPTEDEPSYVNRKGYHSINVQGICDDNDRTRIPKQSGSDVVEAVVNLIREACIFPNDKLYLRRLAYVESMDGMEVNTYRPNYYGGIWQVDQSMFNQIATAKVLDNAKNMIKDKLGIDWSKVQWMDLLKPLYSGLGSALFNLLKAGANGIPRGIEYQANFWVNSVRPQQLANVFYTKANKLETGCKRTNALDLVFALDSSTSLSPQDFEVAKQFVRSIVDSFQIGPAKTQVGLLKFSTTVTGEFMLNQYSTSGAIKKAIDGVQYKSGGTHTDEAIAYAVNNMFTPAGGARSGSSKVLIILTDGRASNGIEAERMASEAKRRGISIFAIGVTMQVIERELNAIASRPTCTHVQILKQFGDLDSLKAEIEQVSCKAPAVLTSNNYTYNCNSDVAVQILPNVKAGTTVTVMVDDGEVEVFGSLTTSNPNAIINDFFSISTVRASTSFFIKGDKQVALAFVSNKPASCKSTFRVNVEEGMRAHPNTHLLCIEDNLIQNCTAETLQKSPYLVLPPGNNKYVGLCTSRAEFFVFPERNDRFIYCDGLGHFFIVLCPLDDIFEPGVLRCVPGKLVLTPLTTTSTPLTSTLTPVPTTIMPTGQVVPTGTPSNPCTPQNLALGLYYFEYPGNDQLYIECYNLPYVAIVKSCDVHHYWSQKYLTCLYREVVVNPTQGIYNGKANPCNTIPNLFYYPLPDNTKYIHCDDFGDAFEKTCPNNFIWSQPILQCIPRGVIFSAPPPVVG